MSSSQPIVCVAKPTHRFLFAELTEFAAEVSEWNLSSETVLSKQDSARFLQCQLEV